MEHGCRSAALRSWRLLPLLFAPSRRYGRCLTVFLLLLALCLPEGFAAEKRGASAECRSCHDVLGAPHLSDKAVHAALDCGECHQHALSREFHGRAKTLPNSADQMIHDLADHAALSEAQVLAVHARCRSCHKPEFAEWAKSRHALTYAGSFLNREHNRIEEPINDCLRCHAAFFQGAIEDMVRPLDTQGPWKLTRRELAGRPSMPCLVCHQIHLAPEAPGPSKSPHNQARTPSPGTAETGFYDRREKAFFALGDLPQPRVHQGGDAVKVSSDPRIRNCYQCHAPSAAHQAGTSDDRTLLGVHAGLSCGDCHATHSLKAQNSCASCHPKISHCGRDVTGMDTTASHAGSAYNIHTVACGDCHQGRRPTAKPQPK